MVKAIAESVVGSAVVEVEVKIELALPMKAAVVAVVAQPVALVRTQRNSCLLHWERKILSHRTVEFDCSLVVPVFEPLGDSLE